MQVEILQTEFGYMVVPSTDINQVQYYKYNKVHIDQKQINLLANTLKEVDNPVIVDCGTNVGFFAFGLNKLLPNTSIYCFEAQRIIFNMLKSTCAINEFNNIHIFHNVVSSESEKEYPVPVYDFNIESNFGSVEVERFNASEFIGQNTTQYEQVKSKTIDSLNLQKASLIKFDVEGMEEKAIAGAHETIKRCRPVLFIEYIKSNRNNLVSMVNEHRYNIIDIGDNYLCTPMQ